MGVNIRKCLNVLDICLNSLQRIEEIMKRTRKSDGEMKVSVTINLISTTV